MRKITNSLGLIFSILGLSILCSCSDKNNDDVIYYPYGSVGIKGVVYSIDGDHAAVIDTDENGEGEDLDIVSEIKKDGKVYPVTVIRGNAFFNKELKKLTIPSCIVEIEDKAFQGANIEELYIDDLKSWCEIEFGYEVYFSPNSSSSGVTSSTNPIGKDTKVYVDNKLMTELVIPSGIEKVRELTFQNLTIDKVVIGDEIKEIEDNAFKDATINILTLGKNVTSIGWDSFSKINTIFIPQGISEDIDISSGAFWPTIVDVNVPDFHTWLYMTDSPEIIKGYHALVSQGIMAYAPRSSYNLIIEGTKLKDAVIPGRIKDFKKYGLAYCSISKIEFEEGVENIEAYSLMHCEDLVDIKLPSSLQKICVSALFNSKNIKSIEFSGIVPPEVYKEKEYEWMDFEPGHEEEFYFQYLWENGCELIVPQESVELYKTTYPWSEFKNIRGK